MTRVVFVGAVVKNELTAVRDALNPLLDAGKTADDAVAAHPTARFDARWGHGPVSPEQFVRTMTEKLLIYALGRGLYARDMPTVRAIMREGAARDYRFSSLVFGIVHSAPFTMRLAQPEVRAIK